MQSTEIFIETLRTEFEKNRNPKIAGEQKAYMKNRFEFYGIKAPDRRVITKPFLVKAFLPDKAQSSQIVYKLWEEPYRDFHYFGQELLFKYHKKFEKEDILILEFMVENNSWWDTVDYIAVKLMGGYFKMFPEQIDRYVKKWIASKNMWLQRSAILFQLKYKDELNKELMAATIKSLLGSKEFFINKAIGWMLREYSRSDPDYVRQFCKDNLLSNLSRREALRLLKLDSNKC